MRALVINLAPETQRLAFQRVQAERLGLGLDVLPAVCVAQLPKQSIDLDWTRWQRPLRDVERACLLSHRLAWQRVIALGGPILILEDDAWLMPSAAPFLAQAAQLMGMEHLSLETRGRKKLLGAAHPQLPGLRRLWLDRTGAAAYVLWPEGARKLLERSTKVPALADAVMVEAPHLKRWQATPAQAIQIDMAARYGLTPPIAVCSTISGVARPLQGGPRQRFRRYMRQLAMGIAMLRPGTERIELHPQVDGHKL
jgi:glycosyl transferase family 25